jgi:prepilin-type N-terminal cleavage/methylation domain-containing protein
MVDISILLALLKVIFGNMQQYSKDTFINEAGFSLIELMFVIMILAILIPMAMLTYSGIQVKMTTDLVNVDFDVIKAAARTFYMNNQTFPPDLVTLVTAGYLDGLPHDKFASSQDYKFTPTAKLFTIRSVGPNGKDDGGAADDVVLTFGP